MTANTEIAANSLPSLNTMVANDNFMVVSANGSMRLVKASNAFGNSNVTFITTKLILSNNSTTPSNSTANCVKGEIWFDSSYVYFATANNVIKRVALTSF